MAKPYIRQSLQSRKVQSSKSKRARERERTETAGKNVCKWPNLMRSPLVNLNVISSLPSISGFGQWSVPPNSAESVKDSELRRLLAAHMERLSVCMVRLGQKGAARSNQISHRSNQCQVLTDLHPAYATDASEAACHVAG